MGEQPLVGHGSASGDGFPEGIGRRAGGRSADASDLLEAVPHVRHRRNDLGPDGVGDRRRHNGADPRLTAGCRDALYAALRKRPPDGGLWTGPKVARYVRGRWPVAVRPETGWRWLRGLGFAPRVPRPSHPQSADPGRVVEVWAEDEARLGLKPITRRV